MKEKPKLDLTSMILSPMPGAVVSVSVNEGDVVWLLLNNLQVSEGAELAVVEAMKMQNKLLATRTGKVKRINTKLGEQVEEGKILVELE